MAKIYSIDGSVKGEAKLPKAFSTDYRPDVIKKAVLCVQSENRQPYGADILAGQRTSAHYHGRRRDRTTMMGRGIARMARIHGKVGSLSFRARFVPQAVKGRGAHSPKAEAIWARDMNRKEMLLAIKSALGASTSKDLVSKRGHIFEMDVPLVLESKAEDMKKTAEIKKLFEKIGLASELERCEEKRANAGKGKRRGRRTKEKKGVLVIVSKECNLLKAAENLPGVDAIIADDINVELLAPGARAGRLILLTEPSLEVIEKKY